MAGSKIERFISSIPDGLDGVMILSPENRRYFTGFGSSDGILLISPEKSVFFTDSRYTEAAFESVKDCDVAELKRQESVLDMMRTLGMFNVGIETSYVTLREYTRLKNTFEGVNFITDDETDRAILRQRMIKSEDELECIKRAQSIAEKSFEYILTYIRAGRTEREIQLELDNCMLRNGAEALSFETIAVGGKNSSRPHGCPTDYALKDGDLLTMDFGAVYNGYHSDMTRTVCIGRAGDDEREVYETVLSAQKAALNTICAGISCADGDASARDVIAGAGFGENFGHSLGHGVGIEIHEAPNLSPSSTMTLESGMVVTVEPGIYLQGRFGVRIEDMVVVTDSGCENLTHAGKDLIEL